jgi:hypothetical protein
MSSLTELNLAGEANKLVVIQLRQRLIERFLRIGRIVMK